MAGRRRRDCRFLLGTLTFLLVFFPVLEEMARPILNVAIIGGAFVIGVIVVQAGRFHVKNAIALAGIQLALTALTFTQTVDSPGYLIAAGLGLATTTLLIGYSIYCVVSYVLQARHITRDQIYAGICAYLMLGFAFGCIYYLVELLAPGCFAVNTGKLGGGPPDLMYFSFVTLATLGYGDITPVAKISRVLAEVEALAGMLYIAIFMARLVSMAGNAPADVMGAPPNELRASAEGRASETTSPFV
jgi:hypothetical protein